MNPPILSGSCSSGKIPYCSIVSAEEKAGKWELKDPQFPPLTHSHNQRFDISIFK